MRVASARARVLKRYSSLYLSVLTRVAGAEATILTPDTRSPDAAPTLASMVTSLSILAPKGQLARERKGDGVIDRGRVPCECRTLRVGYGSCVLGRCRPCRGE